MRIAVVGGGPAGLYFAYRWKSRHPDAQIDLFESSPPDATWGFGVVFSERAMDFLRSDDPATADYLSPHMETWQNMTINHAGETVILDGIGFSAIGRLEFMNLLQSLVHSVGITPRYNTTLNSMDELQGYDLIIAADGLNSLVRRSFEGDFGTSISYLNNKFAWFGTTKPFDSLTQTFVKTDLGTFNAHHYRYAANRSTFIVECDRATWLAYGFDTKSVEDTRHICEEVFAKTLDGHALVSNRSVWRNFPWLWNERWSFRNMVLVGDALHTAHYSIGSGTRLAMEDVIALIKALEAEPGDLQKAFALYEASRRPIVETLVAAAKKSAAWYEDFADHMTLDPLTFTHNYIMRSGRISPEKLARMAPQFAARWQAAQK